MEENSLGSKQLFYRILKTLKKGKQYNIKYIKIKKIIAEEDNIMKRYNKRIEEILISEIMTRQPKEIYNEDIQYQRNEVEEITNLEVEVAINLLKRGKAAGDDGITSELLLLLPLHKKGDNRGLQYWIQWLQC